MWNVSFAEVVENIRNLYNCSKATYDILTGDFICCLWFPALHNTGWKIEMVDRMFDLQLVPIASKLYSQTVYIFIITGLAAHHLLILKSNQLQTREHHIRSSIQIQLFSKVIRDSSEQFFICLMCRFLHVRTSKLKDIGCVKCRNWIINEPKNIGLRL